MLETKAPCGTTEGSERRTPGSGRQATPPPVMVLASAGEFRRQMDRQALRCKRMGEAFSVLSLQVLQDDEAIEVALALALLDECARRLCSRVRVVDTVARWQDSHFGILLPRCPPVHAPGVLARLTRAVDEPYSVADHSLRLRLLGQVLAVGATP